MTRLAADYVPKNQADAGHIAGLFVKCVIYGQSASPGY